MYIKVNGTSISASFEIEKLFSVESARKYEFGEQQNLKFMILTWINLHPFLEIFLFMFTQHFISIISCTVKIFLACLEPMLYCFLVLVEYIVKMLILCVCAEMFLRFSKLTLNN